MRTSKNKLTLGIASALLLSTSFAGTITGGNAASEADAKIVLDLAIGTDTTGSITATTLNSVSDAISQAIPNISCADKTWVKARAMGIDNATVGSTIFDETADDVLDAANNPLLEDSTEDLAPFSTDAINFYPWSTPQAGKNYFKAVLTIGDEGLDDGEPTTQADYDSGHIANQAAIANNTALFVIALTTGFTDPETHPSFKAMAEGTGANQLGGHTFEDTGGVMIDYASNPSPSDLQARMEDLICKAITGPTGPSQVKDPTKIPSTSFYSLLAMVFSLGFIARKLKRRK